MGKRKHADKEDDCDHCAKKMRKSKKKKHSKKKRKHSTSTSCESIIAAVSAPKETGGPPPDEMDTMYEFIDDHEVDLIENNPTLNTEPVPSTSDQYVPSTSAAVTVQQYIPDQTPISVADLQAGETLQSEQPEPDPIILDLLGDDPTNMKKYGKEIQADLAVRLQHIIANGITKDLRKELHEKYLPPSNCTLIDAPALNAEMSKVVSDAVSKRDKGIEMKQKQLGAAISGLAEALTILLSKSEKDSALIKILMDSCRLLCDCQNLDSNTRRNFVLFNLTKDHKDQLQKTKIDNFLFGTDLAETIKISKNLCTSAAALVNPPSRPPRPATNRNVNNNRQFANQPFQRNNLNWKPPPPPRRPKAPQRGREPAPPRHPPANFSRSSYRDRAPPPPPPPPAAHYRSRR